MWPVPRVRVVLGVVSEVWVFPNRIGEGGAVFGVFERECGGICVIFFDKVKVWLILCEMCVFWEP